MRQYSKVHRLWKKADRITAMIYNGQDYAVIGRSNENVIDDPELAFLQVVGYTDSGSLVKKEIFLTDLVADPDLEVFTVKKLEL